MLIQMGHDLNVGFEKYLYMIRFVWSLKLLFSLCYARFSTFYSKSFLPKFWLNLHQNLSECYF